MGVHGRPWPSRKPSALDDENARKATLLKSREAGGRMRTFRGVAQQNSTKRAPMAERAATGNILPRQKPADQRMQEAAAGTSPGRRFGFLRLLVDYCTTFSAVSSMKKLVCSDE